jgi:hypothetical protein
VRFHSEGMRRVALVLGGLAILICVGEGVSLVRDLPPKAHGEAWLALLSIAVVVGLLVAGLVRVVDWLVAGFAADRRKP